MPFQDALKYRVAGEVSTSELRSGSVFRSDVPYSGEDPVPIECDLKQQVVNGEFDLDVSFFFGQEPLDMHCLVGYRHDSHLKQISLD